MVREDVHRVICDELCVGRVLHASRSRFATIIEGLEKRGAEGVILGCTEIGLLVSEADSALPVFDTTEIHARGAARWSLE